jgi:DNA-binding LytR/AlgR family response regulator
LKPLKLLIVDDEPLARRRLQLVLAGVPGIELVGLASGRLDGLKQIRRFRPDIVLLDIRMRDGTGFDLIDALEPDNVPAVIFVTAFDGFAVQAFDTMAVDYLLKPVERARLERAIERARDKAAAKDAEERVAELKAVLGAIRSQREDKSYETEFWVRRNASGLIRIAVEQIDYATAEDDYVRLHLAQHSHLTSETLAGLEKRLDPRHFVRIHRSSIVRIAAVKEIRRTAVGALEAGSTPSHSERC